MNHIEKAIGKAVENGFDIPKTGWEDTEEATHALIFQSPLFWQCLGKGLAKEKGGIPVHRSGASYMQHDFIDHLASNKSPNSFFETLLSK